jgi:uncharacterized protein YjbI with pentapeptide repeats
MKGNMKTKIQIKSWCDESVLFEHETEDNTIKITLELAIKSKVNLNGSDLRYSDLRGSNLSDSNLSGSDLRGSNLSGSNLSGSNLNDKSKCLSGKTLIQIGGIGSRDAILTIFITDKDIRLQTGCFFGDEKTFFDKLKLTHGNNEHAKNYKAAIKFAKSVLIKKR